MEKFDLNSMHIYIIIFFAFIVAMILLKFIDNLLKKIFECNDEIDYGVQNRFIGKIWISKKPKEENNIDTT
ncbi:hypothetical protein NZ698_04860 [Chryseobacterium sp. PBS4-4]|uniref:Uncharacterized protein n=1 Tax=Chryseobacterium edaphi TaxID=2976532 RepID=A0ABT2W2S7_9FLAO|nr:hypothetical protein [Chryseobacterium edaphi]MCU7616518.1 hypothetical protein [Chryseobacterium edaphi]